MARQPETRTTPRAHLTRERVLRAAIDLADEAGIESLSMRRLGQALGVEAMSLYNHVEGKADLLDGMVDLVVDEIEVPSKGESWKPAMRRRAISAREMLARHPWAAGLIESSADPSTIRLGYAEAVLGCLRDAGFSVAMAVHAFSALDSYIYGFALQERSLPFRSADEMAAVGRTIMREPPADRSPRLAEVVTELVLGTGYDFRDEFEFGLDLLLDALERAQGTARDGTDRPGAGGHEGV